MHQWKAKVNKMHQTGASGPALPAGKQVLRQVNIKLIDHPINRLINHIIQRLGR